MEILILMIALAIVVVGAATFVATRRRREVEPPPAAAEQRVAVEERPPEVAAPPAPAEVVPAPPAPPAEVEPAPPTEVAAPPVKPSFRERLAKARSTVSGYVGSILSREKIDGETWDDLEEALIRADVGVAATTSILERLRAAVDADGITDPDVLLERLKAELKTDLATGDRSLRLDPGTTNVWLFVGVNGVGKTTTIGKVARLQHAEGHSVVMAAGDTFRAAAAEQLTTWAERAGAEIVRGNEGGDPSAVVFDAVQHAAASGRDLVLADTAGRLHTKVNLMEELRKVRRVADRDPGNVTEVLLVLDATTGQNGLVQAKEFTDAVDLTGVVLTKLDGSAKGGIALAIASQLGIPIKLVGLGESVDDLVPFDPDEFVEALFAA
jgi:fused signal recognition particle receptor